MKTVILIHGYLTNYQDFANLPSKLIQSYDNVVILSLPGHGHHNDINKFTVKDTISMVESEVEFYLKKGSVDLIGYSMGGALSRYLAVKYPSLNKIVLLAPASKYLAAPFIRKRLKYIYQDNNKDNQKNRFNDIKNYDKELVDFARGGIIQKFNIKNGLTFCKLIHTINKYKGNNNHPTLIVQARLDELIPYRSIKFCYENCTSSDKELYVIEDIGHLMLRSNKKEEISNKILTFLKK